MQSENNASYHIANVSILVLLTLFSFMCLYPFYYIFIYSISVPSEAERGILFLPKGFTLENYRQLFIQNNIMQAAFISVARTVVGAAITVFCTSLFAFILTQNKLKFKKAIYRLVIATMFVNAGLIPWYMTMSILGLKNNFLLYVIPSAVGAFYLVLIKTYMEQLPIALQESAMIDGAGFFTIFMKIILPISKPVIATVAIFSAVDQWNTWMDNFYLVSSPSLKTLQFLLLSFMADQNAVMTSMAAKLKMTTNRVEVTPMSIRMTITMIATLPILFVYPVFQKYFVKGIMVGAIKG